MITPSPYDDFIKYPPLPSFYFEVRVGMLGSIAFSEVSGLSFSYETEKLLEGGGFEYTIPVTLKHNNLVCKRALTHFDKIMDWVSECVYNRKIHPENITISLLDQNCNPQFVWYLERAYPVKFDLASLKSTENALLFETIEFAYADLYII